MKRMNAAFSTAAAILVLSNPAHALQCRTASGQSFETATSSEFSAAVKDCTQGSSSPTPLSPLLQLYESNDAQTRIPIEPAPRSGAVAPNPRRTPRSRRPAVSPPPVVRAAHFVRPTGYPMAVTAVARAYDIDPAFLAAIIQVESGQNPAAVSPKGAVGLMQVMPSTARRFGLTPTRLTDPLANLSVGAVYLKSLQQLYGDNLPLVLAAYNAGEGAVERHHRRPPPYRETTGYIADVLGRYRDALYSRQATAGGGATLVEGGW